MVGYAWIISRPHNRGTGRANPPYRSTPLFILYRRQRKRGIDQGGRTFEIIVAIDVLLHHERGAAVELLVLLVAAAEFRADEVPSEPHQRHLGFRVGGRRAHVALDVARRLLALEVAQRRRQRDHRGTRELADD